MHHQPTQAHFLLLSDDNESLDVLQDIFLRNGYQINTLLPGEHLQHYLRSEPVHVALLDVKRSDHNQFFWLKQLKKLSPQLPVVILSDRKESEACAYALEQGANDYLSKPFTPRELLARIKIILNYSYPDWTKNTFKSNQFIFDFDQSIFTNQGVMLNLTPRESELLQVFCQNQNQLLTREYLVEKTRRKQYHPLDRHIDVHINHLRKKIEADPKQPHYIRTIWGQGYSFSMH